MTDRYRKDFPILRNSDTIYFDNAATAQRPEPVLEAVRKFDETTNANPLRGLYSWSLGATELYQGARHRVAELLGAEDDCEIIFTRNTTESINLVAYAYALSRLQAGDEIALTIMEHHSNLLPWQMVCKKTGAKLVFLEPDKEGTIPEEEIISKIGERTKIAACCQVSNVLGVTNPVKKIADRAHSFGAVVVVDAAQSVPHIPVKVKEIGADFLAFSGHKICAPMGIGVLYGRRNLLEEMDPFLRGGEMIEYVTRESATYAPLPAKFEAGTVNASGAVGLGAAIDYIQKVGYSEIAAQEKHLTRLLMEEMQRIPYVTVYGSKDPEKHCGIVTFNIEGCHPHDVASVLDAEHICIRAGHHCAQPLMQYLGVNATARASLYFYNTEEEVMRFVKALREVRGWLGYSA